MVNQAKKMLVFYNVYAYVDVDLFFTLCAPYVIPYPVNYAWDTWMLHCSLYAEGGNNIISV